MPAPQTTRVFVLEAAGKALVAYEAIARREADELRREQWFIDELAALRSEGRPIWDGSTLGVRTANEEELAQYREGACAGDGDELVLVYLVPLDG